MRLCIDVFYSREEKMCSIFALTPPPPHTIFLFYTYFHLYITCTLYFKRTVFCIEIKYQRLFFFSFFTQLKLFTWTFLCVWLSFCSRDILIASTTLWDFQHVVHSAHRGLHTVHRASWYSCYGRLHFSVGQGTRSCKLTISYISILTAWFLPKYSPIHQHAYQEGT